MVSWVSKEAAVKSAFDKFEMKELKDPLSVRIKFRKVGKLQYISHLDLQRVVSRILLRSGVPVWFTQGFNPHPKMVFAMPLSIGAQSECEYLDIRVDREISYREIIDRLNAEVTEEMRILRAYTPKSKFSDIAYVKYVITVHCDEIDESVALNASKLFKDAPLKMIKRSKSGEKEVDITSYIKDISISVTPEKSLRLEAIMQGGEGTLNPEMLVTALRENLGILTQYPEKGDYTIVRTNLYFSDMREFE